MLNYPISPTLYKSQLSVAVLVHWPIRSLWTRTDCAGTLFTIQNLACTWCLARLYNSRGRWTSRIKAVVPFQACVHSLFGTLFPGCPNQALRNKFSIHVLYWCSESEICTINESGASEASVASNGRGSRGPLKGPWWGPGAAPGLSERI